ncbi:MAG: hypothetical protein COB10_07470, partial [Planctomycetota bacterium]
MPTPRTIQGSLESLPEGIQMSAQSGSVTNESATSNPSTSNKSTALQEIVKKAYRQHSTLREIDDLDVMETTILGALTASMPLSDVLKAWDAFRTQFVDWNEVRISSASEVAAVFPKARDPLQLAMQLKDMLATLFERCHQLSMEFIRENSISETKEFFKRSPSLPDLAKQLVLAHIKNQAVEASQQLAAERGEAPDMKGTGMRNSHLLAIAPLPGLELVGIMGYEGHLLTIPDLAEKEEKIHQALGVLVDAASSLCKRAFSSMKRVIVMLCLASFAFSLCRSQ